ncbi:MAG: hypothetical protein ACRDQU_11585, partial [Pseudonocardiaceae bacterium]
RALCALALGCPLLVAATLLITADPRPTLCASASGVLLVLIRLALRRRQTPSKQTVETSRKN